MKLLFVVNNFNFGGPQKSLVNLLYELEGHGIEADLMIMNQQDKLSSYLPDYVNEVPIHSKYSLLMLDKSKIIKNIISNIDKPIFILKVLLFILKSKLKLQDNTKAKQNFWVNNKWNTSEFEKTYDFAIGVSGGHSVYFIQDYINAKHKIGWIRTDYKVLKRNHDLDYQYFKKMSGMLAVSNMTAKRFEEIFNIKPSVFYNSLPIKLYENIESENFNTDSKYMNLCTICRLDNGKGLDLLIEAAKILKKQKIKFNWYIVGTGKLEEWLKEQILKNNLEKLVLPIGFKFNTGNVLKKMDILVHPSRFEGKSNTIDEALYYEIPVVATNFETVYEQIVDGENGFITNMNGNEIANRIIELCEDEQLYKKIKSELHNNKRVPENKGKEFISILYQLGDNK
ncbi:glycosyltransferase [Staphylococcus caeli]|uniref:glycosyltransferase n=1 Tax=Staphylococcus caeli TaxID=2201815 RepID=UPI003F54F2DD